MSALDLYEGAAQLPHVYCKKIILENKIVKLKEDNKIARMELDSFTNDPEALEGYARSKLNLIKKGEVLIELVPNE